MFSRRLGAVGVQFQKLQAAVAVNIVGRIPQRFVIVLVLGKALVQAQRFSLDDGPNLPSNVLKVLTAVPPIVLFFQGNGGEFECFVFCSKPHTLPSLLSLLLLSLLLLKSSRDKWMVAAAAGGRIVNYFAHVVGVGVAIAVAATS